MTIQTKVLWVRAKIGVAQRMIERAEKASANPRNYYSPERVRKVRSLKRFIACAESDLVALESHEDVELSPELYDLRSA